MNRFRKAALLVVFSIASIVLMRHWLTPPPALPRAVRSASMPSPEAVGRDGARPVPALNETREETSGSRALGEDPRCIIRTTSSPQVSEAAAPDAGDAQAPAEAPADPARELLMQALRTSPDPYANAVAVWLDVGEDDDARATRDRQLAAMAASTRDPRLYALALRTCWGKPGHECQALSARRWSELDPDNAMPWLLMMDEAARHHDISGLQEALHHAAHAQRLAERAQAPVQAIVDAAPGDASSLVAARSLAIDAMGIVAAQVVPASLTACRKATSADANLWQECTAMADLLEHRSDSLFARMVGAAIERRLTGNSQPGERVAAQVRRLAALDLASSSSCADLRSKLALMRRMAVDGEMAVLPPSGR